MPFLVPSITIYWRSGCHLCEVIHRMARRLQADLSFRLYYIDVDSNPDLVGRFGDRVPVVLIDQREIFSGKVTESQLRRAIEKARWRNSISRILSRLKLALKRW
jgi:thioredoxin-like negative regulator of GroEL